MATAKKHRATKRAKTTDAAKRKTVAAGNRKRTPAASGRSDVSVSPTTTKALNRSETAALLAQLTEFTNRRHGVRGNGHLAQLEGLERLGDVAERIAPLLLQNRLATRLGVLRTWQNQATAQLQDLIARRGGPRSDLQPFATTMKREVTKTAHRLVVGMSKNALAISTLEAARERWHAAAHVAREAIRLRRDMASQATGKPLRPDAAAHLKLAYATFMLEGNSPRLRRELKEALQQMPKSKGIAYWLARHEIMVGHYPEAYAAMRLSIDYPKTKQIIQPIVDRSVKAKPWDTYPCNFYTYRYVLLSEGTITTFRDKISEFEKSQSSGTRFVASVVKSWVAAYDYWNKGNRDLVQGKYSRAAQNYADCQKAVLTYFATRYRLALQGKYSVPSNEEGVYRELVRVANDWIVYRAHPATWSFFRKRYQALTLDELYSHGWVKPRIAPSGYHFYDNTDDIFQTLGIPLGDVTSEGKRKIEEKIEAPLLALALIFAPLGIAEANRIRRNFDPAIRECRGVLSRHSELKILSEFIEKPFVKILQGQILLDKAESEYKARTLASSPAKKGGGIYSSPDGLALRGGGNTTPVYSLDQLVVAMIPYQNGVITAFNGRSIYFSPDGRNLGGGGNTQVVSTRTDPVRALIPYQNGVITIFGSVWGDIGFFSPDGKDLGTLGGGVNTKLALTPQLGVHVMKIMPYQSGVITASDALTICYSPDGLNLRGGGTTQVVYSGGDFVRAMIEYNNGIVTAFDSGAIYFSPDGLDLHGDGGGNTIVVHTGNQLVTAMIPYTSGADNGVISAFDDGKIYYSPDGNNLGGGGNTKPVYSGGALVTAMISYQSGVITAFDDGTIYYSADGQNLGGGGNTKVAYAGGQFVAAMIPYQAGVITAFGTLRYQGLAAAETFQGVLQRFEDQGEYVNRVNAGARALSDEVGGLLQKSFHPLVAKYPDPQAPPLLTPDERQQFQRLGKGVSIETVASRTGTLPGLDRRVGPHESLLRFQSPDNPNVLKETNPVIYSLVSEAKSRLMQMDAGLNYLGYSDDYVPPWRFEFLLGRARYFAEHAKGAQTEYLNFLQNAEREEFQEMSAAQNVILEKSNERVEGARVEQSRLEAESAKQSLDLAKLVERNAETRVQSYLDFKRRADELTQEAIIMLVVYGSLSAFYSAAANQPGGAFSTIGSTAAQVNQLRIAEEQREFERGNYELAAREATRSAIVANGRVDVANAGLVVATMQRTTALLRHDFAVQNLEFLRNRTLNAEMWFRLAHLIRGVADTYLRYAVGLAFLAEQAYEFEADKRINIIRFDYDVSEIGKFLAADFLLADLDTLEQDLLTGQRARQQQVRYVLSLGREFPSALQELRDSGSTIFTLLLEQLERRFPGLYNLRIGSVEIMPVALMDPTRFSLEMTYLGTSQVRLRGQPDTQAGGRSRFPLNVSDLKSWLPELDDAWPVKIQVSAPDTDVFSGLTRAERNSIFPFMTSNERAAFEGLGAAASWRMDMSMRENRVVPGTLADMLVTFSVSGYYDPTLRDEVEQVQPRLSAVTKWLSAQQSFPDAFYEFNQTGTMNWQVTEDILALDQSIGALRNAALIMLPTTPRPQFGNMMCNYLVEFSIPQQGSVQILSEVPQVTFTMAPQLAVTAQASGVAAGATVLWDFGEGEGPQSAATHSYKKPGRYEVGLRVISGGRLYEYKAAVVASRKYQVMPPLTAYPSLAVGVGDGSPVDSGKTRVVPAAQVPLGESVTPRSRLGGGSVGTQFDLAPGTYKLVFTAIRNLTARIYSQQRYDPNQQIAIEALRVATNRKFDDQGNETTIAADYNEIATRLFSGGPISPVDHWTLQLTLDDNPFLRTVTPSDEEQIDLGQIADAVLALEYEVNRT